jgi:hypothetical protein
MARKRYKSEEIVAKLRQVDVLASPGQNMVDAIRQIGVSEVMYYRPAPRRTKRYLKPLKCLPSTRLRFSHAEIGKSTIAE